MERDPLSLRNLLGSLPPEPTTILILTPLLVILQRVVGSPDGNAMFVSSFVLFGLIPLAVALFIWRRKPKELGLHLGDWTWGLKAIAIVLPIILAGLVYPASQTGEMRDFYPLKGGLEGVGPAFLQYQVVRGVLFYSSWEFVFRGFMLFGLRKYVGDWAAILIQTIPSCLWHFGFPTGEIFLSLPGGILFGYLALRTGSIIWPWLLHWLVGAGLDFFIVITS